MYLSVFAILSLPGASTALGTIEEKKFYKLKNE
jgi:hypothetical protein